MTLNEFQEKSKRTMDMNLSTLDMMNYATHGLESEAGEVSDIMKKFYQGHAIDDAHVLEELGDVMWCLAACCEAFGFTMDEVAQANIDKLSIRYKEHFTLEESSAKVDHQGG